ncbi:MAG: PEPxxWA-CTERM sorting domain-containing protein [Sphingomonas sp.]
MKFTGFIVAASLTLSAGAANAAERIVNGGFQLSGTGSVPVSWVVTPGSEILTLSGSSYVPCCGAFGSPAQLANQFASFGAGDQPNISTLRQTFSTVAGSTYNVSFDFGAFGGGQQTIFANLLGSDGLTQLGTFSATRGANPNLATTFGNYTLSFVANGATSTIAFNVDPFTASVDGVLDNVSVTGAIPEPATWAMMIVGFGAVGGAMRTRRSKVSVRFAG